MPHSLYRILTNLSKNPFSQRALILELDIRALYTASIRLGEDYSPLISQL